MFQTGGVRHGLESLCFQIWIAWIFVPVQIEASRLPMADLQLATHSDTIDVIKGDVTVRLNGETAPNRSGLYPG
jgi:hypothetical protein